MNSLDRETLLWCAGRCEARVSGDDDRSVALRWIAELFRRAARAATEAQPVVWIIPGDDGGRESGFVDAMAWKDGEFTRPLYAAHSTDDVSGAPPIAPTAPEVDAPLRDRVAKEAQAIVRWLAGPHFTRAEETLTDRLEAFVRLDRAARAAIPAQPVAWMHESDASRVISEVQKANARKDGVASISAVRPYTIALGPIDDAPAPSTEDVSAARVAGERDRG